MSISPLIRFVALLCLAALLSASNCQNSCPVDNKDNQKEGLPSRNPQASETPLPVDVVIPCTDKDKGALILAIDGVKSYVADLRRIIVISKERITSEAEWFPESAFPFQISDIHARLMHNVCDDGKACDGDRHGWLFQQLLKLYSPIVIPDISPNVLIVDADTIFLRPVHFIDRTDGASLYAVGTEYHRPYFAHAKRLLPTFRKVCAKHSGIVHHMFFQRHVIEDLFHSVEKIHQKPFWQAFIDEIDPKEAEGSAASEYELYFNFVFDSSTLVRKRELNWKNVGALDLEYDKQSGFDYISWQHYMRST